MGDRRSDWIAAYDPSSHLGSCTVPTFWVNGTHDRHYVLDSYAKSFALIKGRKTFRIEPNMRHSHPAGWAPREIGIYIDSILKGGIPLPRVGKMNVFPDGAVTIAIRSKTTITKVELYYTVETGIRTERKWQSIPAEVRSGAAMAAVREVTDARISGGERPASEELCSGLNLQGTANAKKEGTWIK